MKTKIIALFAVLALALLVSTPLLAAKMITTAAAAHQTLPL